jgi:tRNA (cytidine32/uridine32-2'-O)-methyltransferase
VTAATASSSTVQGMIMQTDVFSQIRVVLVATSHPGNIGAVARAMKTMRLHRLYLVRPKIFPSADATARATGADDVLYDAVVCDDLASAIAGCTLVVGASARSRSIEWPELGARALGSRVVEVARSAEVALVFGRENSGLSNAELDRCQVLARIPTNPAYRSLNLASAVQVLAYEVQLACLALGEHADEAGAPVQRLATCDELEGLYGHLQTALAEIGYFNQDKPRKLMRRLRRMFNRMQPDHAELNILRGILTAAQQAARKFRE